MPTVNEDYPKKAKEMTDAELKAKAVEQYSKTESGKVDFPTEIIELPSKGKLYPEDHPLSSGTIEMRYMTAKEEDILTNQSYIKQGIVLDKLFKTLIVTPIDYNDLFLGDKNAIMIAARVLGYGKTYETQVVTPNGNSQKVVVDLTKIEEKEIDWTVHESTSSEFDFNLPASKRQVTLRLLTQRIQKKIDVELKGLAKQKKDATSTTLLKHAIIAVDGDHESRTVRGFVDNELLAIDARSIRQYLNSITPDVNLSIDCTDEEDGEPFRSQLAIGLDFFWPDAKI